MSAVLRQVLGTILLVCCLAAAGCSGDPASSGPDTGPERSWQFRPEAVSSDVATITLEAESVDQQGATLLVVARGIDALQGVAFRLQLDPKRLEVIDSRAADAWANAAPTVAALTRQPTGELWAGIGHRGAHGIAAAERTVLARIQVELHLGDEADPVAVPVTFTPGHQLALDPLGKAISCEWKGGELIPVTSPE